MNLSDLTPAIAADRIELFANEERLIQGEWHRRNGRDLACLLGSLHEDINSPSKCPAQVMPEWCANLIVTLFDGIPADSIFDTSKSFAAALRGTASFTSAKWDTVRRKFLHATITQALESARSVESKLSDKGKFTWVQVQEACGSILSQLSQDKDPTDGQRSAAAAAAAYDASAAASAASAAASAAYAAAASPASPASPAYAYAAYASAAYAAASASASAASPAYAAYASASASAASAARRNSYKRLFGSLIDAINAGAS